MDEALLHITNFLFHSYNIDISKYDETFLKKSFEKRIAETHSDTRKEYINLLQQDKAEAKLFLNSLHIHYSEFFRNSLTFSVLEHIIFGLLIQKKKGNPSHEIRIWSAACSGGQEPYSLAMILEGLKSNFDKTYKYRIFATDMCPLHLNAAAKGEYPSHLVNNIKIKGLNLWFDKIGDIYSIKKTLKKNIDFSVFDLFNEQLSSPPASIFGEFDIIVCANLLFYYKDKYRKQIIEKVVNSLGKDGYLIVGEAEREMVLDYYFKEVFPQSAIFQKK